MRLADPAIKSFPLRNGGRECPDDAVSSIGGRRRHAAGMPAGAIAAVALAIAAA
jgi:hypothetical protein